jgi:xanthine/uracil permease
MTRPEDLIYGVDELPPWSRLVFLGAQHAVLMSVYLVLIVTSPGVRMPATRPP